MSIRRKRVAPAVALLILALSTSSSSCREPVTVSSVDLVPAESSISLVQGRSDTIEIAVYRANYAGPVKLFLTSPPGFMVHLHRGPPTGNGATSTVLDANETSVWLTVSPAGGAGALSGEYSVLVRSETEGTRWDTATVAVNVTPWSFTIHTGQAATLIRGRGSATHHLTVDVSGGYIGPLSWHSIGMPANVTAQVAWPPPPLSETGWILLTANALAIPGVYQVKFVAKGDESAGYPSDTAQIEVEIRESLDTVSFRFGSQASPVWTAYQTGEDPWQQMTLSGTTSQGSYYRFAILGRGIGAFVRAINGNAAAFGYETTIVFGNFHELDNATDWDLPGTPKQIQGSVRGLRPTDSALVWIGGAMTAVSGAGGATAQFSFVAPASRTWFAMRRIRTVDGFKPDRIIAREHHYIDDTHEVFDFDSSEVVIPAEFNVFLTGTNGYPTEVSNTAFVTAGQPLTSETSITTSRRLLGIPELPNPLNRLARRIEVRTLEPTAERGAWKYPSRFTDPMGDHFVTLGPSLSPATIEAAGTVPYPRYRVQLASQPEYGRLVSVEFVQGDPLNPGGSDRVVRVLYTPSYFNRLPLHTPPVTWDFTIPDMSAAGFQPEWLLNPGQSIRVSVKASSFHFMGNHPDVTSGQDIIWAARRSTVNSP